jgi:hypothetical protein
MPAREKVFHLLKKPDFSGKYSGAKFRLTGVLAIFEQGRRK